MKTEEKNMETVCAKILALSIIYEKEESCRRVFLEKMKYTQKEINAIIKAVPDSKFRNWIESAIPVMQCREDMSS